MDRATLSAPVLRFLLLPYATNRQADTCILIGCAATTQPVSAQDTADRLMAQAKKALGGAYRLDAVRALVVKGTRVKPAVWVPGKVATSRQIESPTDAVQSVDIEFAFQLPSRFRRTERIMVPQLSPPGPSSVISVSSFDGNRLWLDGQVQTDDTQPRLASVLPIKASPVDQRSFQQTGARYLLALLLYSGPPFPLRFRYFGAEDITGGRANVLEGKGPDIPMLRLYLDSRTALPRVLRYGFSANVKGSVSWQLSDYRTVNGIRLPFQITITRDGKVLSTTEVANYTINPSLSARDFEE